MTRQEALEEMVVQLRSVSIQLSAITALASKALGTMAVHQPMKLIAAEVAREFEIAESAMLSRRQTRALSQPRLLTFYLCIELVGCSFPEVALAFGRNHSTIIHAHETVRSWKGALAARRDALRERLTALIELSNVMEGRSS